jgi:hypothetical protein
LLGGCASSHERLVLRAIEPSVGPVVGGQRVVLRGGGFAEGMEVAFGAEVGAELEVVSSRYAVVTTPPGAPGAVDVVVDGGGGRRARREAGFEYLAAPIVDDLVPNVGPSVGGTRVTIRGDGFHPDVEVWFAEARASGVRVVAPGLIQATTPPGAGGRVVDVSVVDPYGQTGTLARAFTYRGGAGPTCKVVDVDPGFGTTDVAIVPRFRLIFDHPVSLVGEVALSAIGGREIPVTVSVDPVEGALVVTPDDALHFWTAHALSVSGVFSESGDRCEDLGVAFRTLAPEIVPSRDLRPASARALVRFRDDVLVASPGLRGLQRYELDPDGSARLTAEIRLDERPEALAARGAHVFVAVGFDGVLVFERQADDAAGPAETGAGEAPWLTRVHRIGTPGEATDLDVFEAGGRTMLAIADGIEGVRLVDVSDPLAPLDVAVLDRIDEPGQRTVGVSAEGGRLAVADRAAGVFLADVSDPEAARIVDHGSIGRVAYDVALVGDDLYVAHGPHGVHRFDLASGSLDAAAQVVFGPRGRCTTGCIDRPERLVLAGPWVLAPARRGGVHRYRRGPSGDLSLDGVYAAHGDAWAALATEDHVLVGEEGGLRVYAANRVPADPGGLRFFREDGWGHARELAARGDYLYVAAGSRGLQTYELARDRDPLQLDRDDTPGSLSPEWDRMALGVTVFDGGLLVGDGRAGLASFLLARPDDPRLAGTLPAEDQHVRAVVRGRRGYVCDDNFGFLVVDLADLEAPRVVASVRHEDLAPGPKDTCLDLDVLDDHLYVGSRDRLRVFALDEDGAAPRLAHELVVGDRAQTSHIEVVDGRLYLATSTPSFEALRGVFEHRLRVFSLSDPTAPEEVYASPDLGGAGGVARTGPVLFVAGGDAGIHVFDVSDVDAPVLQGTIPTRGDGKDVALHRGVLFVALGEGGVAAVRTGPLP